MIMEFLHHLLFIFLWFVGLGFLVFAYYLIEPVLDKTFPRDSILIHLGFGTLALIMGVGFIYLSYL